MASMDDKTIFYAYIPIMKPDSASIDCKINNLEG